MTGSLTEEKKQQFDEPIKLFDLDDETRIKNKGYPELIISDS